MGERTDPESAIAREVIARAIELQVLETTDLAEPGGRSEPAKLLAELVGRQRLTEATEAALRELVARRPHDANMARPKADDTFQRGRAEGEAFLLAMGEQLAKYSAHASDSATAAGAESSPTPELLLDLRVLERPSARAIEAATFCRIVERLGYVTREQLAAAAALGGLIEDVLLAQGTLDEARCMEVFALSQETRVCCRDCFAIVTDPVAGVCPGCGVASRLGSTFGGTWSDSSSEGSTGARTVVSGSGGAGEIDGFPGSGGTFAGYELLERVAEGGMGVVFKARQLNLNRIVALKVMRGGSFASKSRRRRFLQEAEAAAALKHPCIVPVHEIDQVAGYPFYTMEFIEGITLERYVAEHKLGPRQICALMRGVADAVQHFHLRGIIHRDLKPGNVLVGQDGVPKIIDFGIAKKVSLGESTDVSTVEGELLGTLYYMSPEQAAGKVSEVDTRTDVYALGAIVYELLTGAPPFKGLPQGKVLISIQTEDPVPASAKNHAVDSELDAILDKAMAKERERRYQAAADLARDLDAYERNLPISARPATFLYRLKKVVERRLAAVVATAVTLVVLGSASAWVGVQAHARRVEVRSLLSRARDDATPLDERELLLNRVAAAELAPESELARAELMVLVEARATERRVKEARADEVRRRLEADLARARAEKAASEAVARERARADAEKEARAAGDARAASLLERSRSEKDPLVAVASLGDALAVLTSESSPLRTSVESRRAEVEVGLARAALRANEAGLAGFWVRDARKLAAADASRPELDAIEAEIARLASGDRELEEAEKLVVAGDWLAARTKLEQARAPGVAPGRAAGGAPVRFEKDLDLVKKRCSERARALLGEGQAKLARGDAAGAVNCAREARRFENGEPVAALAKDGEARVASDARRQAASLFVLPESRARAVAVLGEAERFIEEPATKALVRRARLACARLVEDASLAGLAYVPDVPELGVSGCYIQRTEVTNAAWKEFVDARGYETVDLWDEAARPLLATFTDACPGGKCGHRAPRSWTDGGFGDQSNADRPVRGVTFHEARAFARWRSRVAGARYRLPLEREWEAAAGWDPATGAVRAYPWGEAWSQGAIATGAEVARQVGTSSTDVSPLGIADAGGNVLEWVERPGLDPGTKGAAFALGEDTARHFALVRCTGTPGASPPLEALVWIGLRLVREVEENSEGSLAPPASRVPPPSLRK